jgi:hypothetical protein
MNPRSATVMWILAGCSATRRKASGVAALSQRRVIQELSGQSTFYEVATTRPRGLFTMPAVTQNSARIGALRAGRTQRPASLKALIMRAYVSQAGGSIDWTTARPVPNRT